MGRWPWAGWLGVALTIVGGGEWLRSPAAWLTGVMLLGVTVALLARPRLVTLPALLLLLLALPPSADLALGYLAGRPDTDATGRALRSALVTVVRSLDATRDRLDGLSIRAAALDPTTPERLFTALQQMTPVLAPEVGLALVGPTGAPEVWSGTHRIRGEWTEAGLGFMSSGYYAVLEVRRHRPGGGVAVAAATLAADSLLPVPARSLAGALLARYGYQVEFLPAEPRVEGAVAWPADQPVLQVQGVVRTPAMVRERQHGQARLATAVALLAVIISLVLLAPHQGLRAGGLLLLLWVGVRSPISTVLGWGEAWSSSTFFSSILGPLSTSAGPLILTGLVSLVVAVGLWHRGGRWHPALWVPTLVLAVGTPYLIREFGRGITPPAHGVSLAAWWGWHLALLIPAATSLIISAGLLRRNQRLRVRNGPATIGAILAVVAALVGVLAFTGRPGWPVWYAGLWFPAVGLVAFPAPRRRAMICLGIVAGSGAALMTWGASLAGRTDVALQDIRGLGAETDPLVEPQLLEFARTLMAGPPPVDGTQLYRRWSHSALAAQGYPVRLDLWDRAGAPVASAVLDALSVPDSVLVALVAGAGPPGAPAVHRVAVHPGVHYVLVTPIQADRIATVVIGPRTAMIESAALGRSIGIAQDREALYRLSLATSPMGRLAVPESRWRREGWALRLWETVDYPEGPRETHVLIPLGRPPWIQIRGALLILLDVLLLAALWGVAERVVGIPRRPVDLAVLSRSFRARLGLALAVFYILPAVVLGGLAISQLGAEASRSRELVLQRVLRDATPPEGLPGDPFMEAVLLEQGERVSADLALYRRGELTAVSDPILARLGVLPPLLEPSAWHAIQLDGDRSIGTVSGSEDRSVRVSYAAVLSPRGGPADVLATLAPASDRDLEERQADVAALLLLATLLGALAAVVGAERASFALSRPVTDLREAALAFGAGHDPSPPGRQPPEFEPVFDAFERMASDVKQGQMALEQARRRTATVLATVSTGVVAVDASGHVLLANRRAGETMGVTPQPGEPLGAGLHDGWGALEAEVQHRLAFGGDPEVDLELDAGDRRYVIQFASLGPDVGGLVLAINDVTETTRAARILAWGEVASQVAHAIKNPLTPVRLGIQHLQRVRETRPSQLPIAMDETMGRLLSEIDRLDGIARAFARFAAPEVPGRPTEEVPVAEVVGEVAALYELVPGIRLHQQVQEGLVLTCRRDELKEVLLNLFDNSRNAGATELTVRAAASYMEVIDNGQGIPVELLAKVFEPRFTTTSSGAGLGLAIVRRLVEGWGAVVSLESQPGAGTRVRIEFAARNSSGG